MRLTVEERLFTLESYLKTMSYVHCWQSFFLKIWKTSASENEGTLWKVARNMLKLVDKGLEMDIISNTYCKL